MKRRFFIGLALAAVLPLAAEDQSRTYPFFRTAERIGEPGEAAAIPLDAAFYRELDAQYANLRITDADGRAVPFAVRVARPLVRDVTYARQAGKIASFSVDEAANSAKIEYVLDKPVEIARLEFPTQERRFSKKLSLEILDEGGQVVRRIAELPLFRHDRLTGGAHVDFAPVRAARFRAVIRPYVERKTSEYATETVGPEGKSVTTRVRHAAFDPRDVIACRAVERRFRSGDAEKVFFDLTETGREERKGRTVITVDASRVPCRELEIQTSDRHFRRTVEVYAREDNGKFALLARRIVKPENPVVPLPERRTSAYRVEIENGDDAPLKDLRLVWRAVRRLLVFVPPPDAVMLKIRYGGDAPKPHYDIEEYADDFVTRTECYALGAPNRSPVAIPWYRALGTSRRVLGGTLILVGVVLLAVIAVLLRRHPENGG